MQDVFTTPELVDQYIPNLMQRGGFSILIECSAIFEKIIHLPRQVEYLGCT